MEPPESHVRERFRHQKRSGTSPELLLRRELFRRGLRYRVEYRVPEWPRRTIDIAFTRAKVAVFVDGCFWHGCSTHFVPPKKNAAWWEAKVEGNRRRDEETVRHLNSLGWRSVRFWEHESAAHCADMIGPLVSGSGS